MSLFTNNLETNKNLFNEDHDEYDEHDTETHKRVSTTQQNKEHFDDAAAKSDMNKYISKKNDTLDRKIVMTNNYGIINENRIRLVKYLFYFLVILNMLYVCVTLGFVPYVAASFIVSIFVVIFIVLVAITILKNSRLYKIDMEEKYYPKHNPYNLLHYFNKKKKCGSESVQLKKKNEHLRTLEQILLETKRLSVKFELYDKAKQASGELKLMDDHKYENAPYGPYNNEKHILDELEWHNNNLKEIKETINKKLTHALESLQTKSNEYKKKMQLILTDIQNDKTDKINKKKYYNIEQYKFNMAIKNINELQKDLHRL
tara:strand:- start:1947 stop:2894 length:948 start_codon:yes stop_codon:yes gene_type:complete